MNQFCISTFYFQIMVEDATIVLSHQNSVFWPFTSLRTIGSYGETFKFNLDSINNFRGTKERIVGIYGFAEFGLKNTELIDCDMENHSLSSLQIQV